MYLYTYIYYLYASLRLLLCSKMYDWEMGKCVMFEQKVFAKFLIFFFCILVRKINIKYIQHTHIEFAAKITY